jgi:hypothetical protein
LTFPPNHVIPPDEYLARRPRLCTWDLATIFPIQRLQKKTGCAGLYRVLHHKRNPKARGPRFARCRHRRINVCTSSEDFRYRTYSIFPAADATAVVQTDKNLFTRCSNSVTCTTIVYQRYTQRRADGPIGTISISPMMPTISTPPHMRTPPLARLKILCFVRLQSVKFKQDFLYIQ